MSISIARQHKENIVADEMHFTCSERVTLLVLRQRNDPLAHNRRAGK